MDPRHGIFCNRTLNLNAIRAIGYDMDYTLIHYRMKEWEQCAYTCLQERLQAEGWPVGDLAFDPLLAIRGLIIDTQNGNILKANRFGYIKRACHGTRPLDFDTQRRVYQRTLVDLNSPRWSFLNTLFSISEACLYMQAVDLLDRNLLPGHMGYADLYRYVRRSMDETHMEGALKRAIINDPQRFVELDEKMPRALLDQKEAGKKILLISNSEWSYAAPMLSYVFDPFLPGPMTWRDLFDIAIVGARKPDFFSYRMPAFKIVNDEGLLRVHTGTLESGCVYIGGNAGLVEESLGLQGEEILYVGDHIFVDVNISKSILRWRTALVIRELEEEITAVENFREQQAQLSRLMEQKEAMERDHACLHLALQRLQHGHVGANGRPPLELESTMVRLHRELAEIDGRIAPLAQASATLNNPYWGLIMRTGIDKSHLARQLERYADIYTSRVSNFLHCTPFAFLRSQRGSLPHDSGEDFYQ